MSLVNSKIIKNINGDMLMSLVKSGDEQIKQLIILTHHNQETVRNTDISLILTSLLKIKFTTILQVAAFYMHKLINTEERICQTMHDEIKNVLPPRNVILTHFLKNLLTIQFDETHIETNTMTKRQFYDVYIQPKVLKYPLMVFAITDCWINNSATAKTTFVSSTNTQHVVETLWKIININQLIQQIMNKRLLREFSQFVSPIMTNLRVPDTILDYTDDILFVPNEIRHDDTQSNSLCTLLKINENCYKQVSLLCGSFCCAADTIINSTNVSSIIFINLLKRKKKRFEEIRQLVTHNLSEYLNKLNNITIFRTMNCDEHKEYRSECVKCDNALKSTEIQEWMDNSEFSAASGSMLDYLLSNIRCFVDTDANLVNIESVMNDAFII
eukprot:201280_1